MRCSSRPWLIAELSDWSGDVFTLDRRAGRLLGVYTAATRAVGVRDQKGQRSPDAWTVAGMFPDVFRAGLQPHAACRGSRDQLLGAIVGRTGRDAVAERTRRICTLGRSARRIPGCGYRGPTGREHARTRSGFCPVKNAIMVGTVTAAVRGMTGTEKTETLLMWQLTTVSLFHLPLLVFGFHWATPRDFALFFLSGISNLIAQYCWTKSLVLAPTIAVSPFFYFMLLWVTVIAYFVWGEIPTIPQIIGSSIVVAAGLYLLWHESKRRSVAGRLRDHACRQTARAQAARRSYKPRARPCLSRSGSVCRPRHTASACPTDIPGPRHQLKALSNFSCRSVSMPSATVRIRASRRSGSPPER